MQFIPAIDLLDGKVVRLFQGDYNQSDEYQTTATEMLDRFEKAQCQHIHVVDLSGAKAGQPIHLDILKDLSQRKSSQTVIEWGGGLRNIDHVRAALAAGADRIILGSALLHNPELLGECLAEFDAEAIIAGIDAKDGRVQASGWLEDSNVGAVELAAEMASAGLREIIYTDISRDGTLSGPALDSFEEMLRSVPLNMIASGGVGEMSHLQGLRSLAAQYSNLKGIICGKAIYEGHVDPAAAQAFLNGASDPV